jgi:cephalosporin hydroxylase
VVNRHSERHDAPEAAQLLAAPGTGQPTYHELMAAYHQTLQHCAGLEARYALAQARVRDLERIMDRPRSLWLAALGSLLLTGRRLLARLRHTAPSRPSFRPSARAYRTRYQTMSLHEWLVYHQQHLAFGRCTWMGVTTIKNPLDAWVYQEIIHQVRPGVIVEIGSAEGGSTLYLAHLLDLLGSGTVVSVDLDRSRFHVTHPRIVTVTGHSSAPPTVAQVAAICAGQSVLVIHDGDHTREQVLADLLAYAPLVSPGSYLIVEDGIVDLFRSAEMSWTDDDGPLAATEQFLRENPGFVVDAERERYILTYNPRGYLKRVGP